MWTTVGHVSTVLMVLVVPASFSNTTSSTVSEPTHTTPLMEGQVGQHRVVGGRACEIREHPFAASITILMDNDKVGNCGGCLLTEDWVLTVSHCIMEKLIRKGRCAVGAGSGFPVSFTRTETYTGMQTRKATVGVKHPLYTDDYFEMRFDIGLIKVDKPFKKGSKVQLAKLPKRGYTDRCSAGTVAGWGYTKPLELKVGEDNSNYLQCVTLPIVSIETCEETFPRKGIRAYKYDKENVICTMFSPGGKDACKGDSGGPLVCNGVLIGLVKGGLGCAMPKASATYTRLDYYLDFITESIRKYGGKHEGFDRTDSANSESDSDGEDSIPSRCSNYYHPATFYMMQLMPLVIILLLN